MYILRISFRAFIKEVSEEEIVIVSNPDKATVFDKIGDAMREAAKINANLETNKIHVFSL